MWWVLSTKWGISSSMMRFPSNYAWTQEKGSPFPWLLCKGRIWTCYPQTPRPSYQRRRNSFCILTVISSSMFSPVRDKHKSSILPTSNSSDRARWRLSTWWASLANLMRFESTPTRQSSWRLKESCLLFHGCRWMRKKIWDLGTWSMELESLTMTQCSIK